MRVLCVHPGPLMYTKVFLLLEPLGLELVAAAVRRAGHQVRLIDLQVESHHDYHRLLEDWRPDVVAFSVNYLANIPEVIDLAKATRRWRPGTFIFAGGHSASFQAQEMLGHAAGALDCVLSGEGETHIAALLEAAEHDRAAIDSVPGVVSRTGEGPRPGLVASLDDLLPARDLVRHRRRYFMGALDPCASIEFSRGCPWDCSFCSAWTFYGRSYRIVSPDRAVDDLARISEPGVFIVDDVAFVQEAHGLAIAEAIARRGLRKRYYLETRADVLLRNKDVFAAWKKLGLEYIFIGLEAIDEEGLARFRKRVPLGQNFEALAYARSLGLRVAINLIADPDWTEQQFRVVRDWCREIPEIVNVTVRTPYPGTEIWAAEAGALTTRDYRLFDIQHAVLPTRLPLRDFYRELVATQRIMQTKHMGWRGLAGAAGMAAGSLARGQTNFVRSMFLFHRAYDADRLLADHERPVAYELSVPANSAVVPRQSIYIHRPRQRRARQLDDATERFVDATRIEPPV